jgi:two-component system response regulator YesN
MKLLLIEDDKDLIVLYGRWVKSLGYEHSVCENGFQAGIEILKQTESHNFDIIVTDLRLPGKSGEELIDFLTSIETGHDKTPILILSGFIDEKLKIKFKKKKNIYYLEKPVSKETLSNTLEEIRTLEES